MRRPAGRGDTLEDTGGHDIPLFRARSSPRGPDITEDDHRRLGAQLAAVRDLMLDGAWRSLADIASATGAPEASASARLRDLRRPACGALRVERRRVGNAFEYRIPSEDA